MARSNKPPKPDVLAVKRPYPPTCDRDRSPAALAWEAVPTWKRALILIGPVFGVLIAAGLVVRILA